MPIAELVEDHRRTQLQDLGRRGCGGAQEALGQLFMSEENQGGTGVSTRRRMPGGEHCVQGHSEVGGGDGGRGGGPGQDLPGPLLHRVEGEAGQPQAVFQEGEAEGGDLPEHFNPWLCKKEVNFKVKKIIFLIIGYCHHQKCPIVKSSS